MIRRPYAWLASRVVTSHCTSHLLSAWRVCQQGCSLRGRHMPSPLQDRPRKSSKPNSDRSSECCAPRQCWDYFCERTTSVRNFQACTEGIPQTALGVHGALFLFDAHARTRQYVLVLYRTVGFAADRQGNLSCLSVSSVRVLRCTQSDQAHFLPSGSSCAALMFEICGPSVGPSSADDRPN